MVFSGNEISKVEGLESLRNLRELVLDKNKIRVITETSFFFQTNLIELHLEENRIRELSYFDRMIKLEKLFLGSNKVQVNQNDFIEEKKLFFLFKEVCEVEKLIPLICLGELSLINNPVRGNFMRNKNECFGFRCRENQRIDFLFCIVYHKYKYLMNNLLQKKNDFEQKFIIQKLQ